MSFDGSLGALFSSSRSQQVFLWVSVSGMCVGLDFVMLAAAMRACLISGCNLDHGWEILPWTSMSNLIHSILQDPCSVMILAELKLHGMGDMKFSSAI